ncbi:hypothetical protein ACLKA7_011360 [Drosophila subpalustris]
MKLSIRTLDQRTISLELDENETQNVLQLKQRLVQLPEISQLPVESVQLIYAGRIMQDDQLLSHYNITESKFIVLMSKRQKKQVEAKEAEEQPKQEVKQPIAVEPQAPSTAPDEQRVRDLINMGYEEQNVRAALRASFNHPERAIEYLITGIPPAAAATPAGTATPAAAAPENAVTETAERLQYLATNPRFAHVRDMIRQNPELLELVLQHLSETDPGTFEAIRSHQEEFIQMLNVPLQPATDTLSHEEEAAVERLMALGFDRDSVVQVYLACDRNEELAAQLLFSQSDDEDQDQDHDETE